MVYLDARPVSAAILNGDSRQLSSLQAPKLEISYYSHVSWFDYLQATMASAAEYTLTNIAPPHPDLWSFSKRYATIDPETQGGGGGGEGSRP